MDQKSNKKIIVQFVCVILSFSLWLYINNVENPIKESTIRNVPVEITNIDSLNNLDIAVVKQDEYTVDVNVSGPTNQIYSLTNNDFKLKVDLSQYALKQGENTIPVEVVDYPDGINIKNTSSLAIKIKVEAYTEKELSIQSDVKLNFKNGFSEKSKIIEPESIKVSGPKSLIDKVSKAVIKGEINDISDDVDNEYDIVILDEKDNEIEGLRLSSQTALLKVQTVKGKEVPIKTSLVGKLKDGLILESSELSLSKVTITGDMNVVDKIESIQTSDIDLSNINGTQQLEVSLVVPEGITISNSVNKVTLKLEIKDGSVSRKTIYGVKIDYSDMDTTKFTYEMAKTCDIVISGNSDVINKIKETDIKVSASLADFVSEGTYSVNWHAKLDDSINAVIVNNTGTVSVKVSNI